jgi:hypothetical protein
MSLTKYRTLARKASYHYADDSTSEWGLGDRAIEEAIKLFKAMPAEDQKIVLETHNELWSRDKLERVLRDE